MSVYLFLPMARVSPTCHFLTRSLSLFFFSCNRRLPFFMCVFSVSVLCVCHSVMFFLSFSLFASLFFSCKPSLLCFILFTLVLSVCVVTDGATLFLASFQWFSLIVSLVCVWLLSRTSACIIFSRFLNNNIVVLLCSRLSVHRFV